MSDSNGHRRWPVILQPLSVPTVLKGTMFGRVETGDLTDAELRGLARAWEADLLVYAAQCRAFRAASSR